MDLDWVTILFNLKLGVTLFIVFIYGYYIMLFGIYILDSFWKPFFPFYKFKKYRIKYIKAENWLEKDEYKVQWNLIILFPGVYDDIKDNDMSLNSTAKFYGKNSFRNEEDAQMWIKLKRVDEKNTFKSRKNKHSIKENYRYIKEKD